LNPIPTFFASPAAFRTWLAAHAANEKALLVGFYKVGSGRASITWPQAVDEALCVGWVDGVRKRIDDTAYQIRFTPRKAVSIWSAVNIERVRVLAGEGRMQPAGLAAYARRSEAKSGIYAYEQTTAAELSAQELAQFQQQSAAYEWFAAQAPSYRKRMLWWVVGAKQATTRTARLLRLIAASAAGLRL
jgi:uncharacterized protein YdeI (YjbR/CyaY-like superfamily)